MTVQGSGPQLSPTNTLREFTFTFFMDASASDLRQTPAIGASVTLYKKGATANGGGSVAVAGSGAVSVHSSGQIKMGDAIFADLATTIQATVTAVTTTGIAFNNVVGGALTWSDGSRIRANTNKPTLYSDDHSGNTTTNPVTLDANGFAQCWAEPGVVDVIVSGGGITTAGYADVTAQPLRSEVRLADEFPGDDWGEKVANALADLNETYGGVVDARGLIGSQSVAVDPFTGITWPFLLLVGAGTINCDVGINPTSNSQRIVGLGTAISTFKASLSFPTSERLFTVGPTGAGSVNNTALQGVTLDCNGMSSSVGLRARGLQPGCVLRDLRIQNAKQYAAEVPAGAWSPTAGVVLRNSILGVTDAAAVGMYIDTSQQIDVVDAFCTSSVVAAAGIRKVSASYCRFVNVAAFGSGFTSLIRLSAEATGGVAITDACGNAGTTNVVLVDTGINDYTLRNIVRNSATRSLSDTDRALNVTTDIIEFTSGITYRYETGGTTSHTVPANSTTPDWVLAVPAGAVATQYAFSETVNAVQKFGLRKDGWVAVERLLSTFGTQLVAGDWAISATSAPGGWGVGATVGSPPVGTTDFCGLVTVSPGSAPGADPTATLTFKTPFTATPVACLVTPASGSGAFGSTEYIRVTALGTTTVQFTFIGTPDASPAVYQWYFMVIGR